MGRFQLIVALALVATPSIPALAGQSGWAEDAAERARQAASSIRAHGPAREPAHAGSLIERAKDAAVRMPSR